MNKFNIVFPHYFLKIISIALLQKMLSICLIRRIIYLFLSSTMPWDDRIDAIMSWIKDKNKPANLVYAYFEEPDNTGHLKGTESKEIQDQIVKVDITLRYTYLFPTKV